MIAKPVIYHDEVAGYLSFPLQSFPELFFLPGSAVSRQARSVQSKQTQCAPRTTYAMHPWYLCYPGPSSDGILVLKSTCIYNHFQVHSPPGTKVSRQVASSQALQAGVGRAATKFCKSVLRTSSTSSISSTYSMYSTSSTSGNCNHQQLALRDFYALQSQ